VVNLDPAWTQSGWVELPLEKLGLPGNGPFEAHDLLTGHTYMWNGAWNYVELNPLVLPAHILRLQRLGE
jgi:starch synthase (maltosyl-transferring)